MQLAAAEPGGERGAPRALAVRAPAGLHVRIEAASVGDGPFRTTALTRTVVDIDLTTPWTDARPRDLCGLGVLSAIALWLTSIGFWYVAVALGILIAIGTSWSATRRRRSRLFTIHDGHIILSGGGRLALADITRVRVREGLAGSYPDGISIHEIVVDTPAETLRLATVTTLDQARHVERIVESAREPG
jgi:hypothetical protein